MSDGGARRGFVPGGGVRRRLARLGARRSLLLLPSFSQKVIGVSLRDAGDVGEGEVFGDDGAPAVCAEADGRRVYAASGHSAPPVCV